MSTVISIRRGVLALALTAGPALGQTPPPASPPVRPATNAAAPGLRAPAVPASFPRRPGATLPPAAAPSTRPGPPGAPGRPGPVIPPGGAAAGASAAGPTNSIPTPAPLAEGAADGAEGDPDSNDVIEMNKMPLDQFLDVYGAEARKSVLRGQGLPNVQVDFKAMTPLNHQERMEVYDTILALNGVTMIATTDKVVLAVANAQAMTEGAPFSRATNGAAYPEASQFVTHIVQLKHLTVDDASEVCRQFAKNQNGIIGLPSSKTLIVRDYAINVKRMLEVLQRVDVEPVTEYQMEVIPIRYGRVEDIYATMSSVIGGGGGGVGVGGAGIPGGTGLTGRSAGGRGGFGGGGGGYGGYGSTGGYGGGYGSTGGYGGGYGAGSYGSGLGAGGAYRGYTAGGVTPLAAAPVVAGAAGVGGAAATRAGGAGTFQGRFNSTGRGGPGQSEPLVTDAQITPDERSNSLIVYASKKDMATIKKVLAKVDTLLPQVLIEGIVMTVDLQHTFSWGFGAGQSAKVFGKNITGGGTVNNGDGKLGGILTNAASAFPAAEGFAYYAQLGRNWSAVVNTAVNDSRVEVLQRPRIVTSHAVPATFFAGSSIPYQQGGYAYAGGTSYTYASLPVGVSLDVTPFITPDNLVVMDVGQQIQDVVGTVDTSKGIPPETSNKSAHSVVSVNSGDAVLMGGYINHTRSKSNGGVPYLKDIPLLGLLFQNRSDNNNKNELMVLIRPTILPSPKDLARMSERQQRESGPIRALKQNNDAEDRVSRRQAAEIDREEDKAAAREAAEDRIPHEPPHNP